MPPPFSQYTVILAGIVGYSYRKLPAVLEVLQLLLPLNFQITIKSSVNDGVM